MRFLLLSLFIFSNIAQAGFFTADIDTQSSSEVNIIKNSGAENGLSGWSEIGAGTFITSSVATDVGRGTTSFAMDMATGADSLESDGYLIPNDIAGTLCVAEMKYKGAGTADIIFTAEDADNTALGSTTIVNAETTFRRAYFTFICPASTGTTNERTVNVKLSTAGNPAAITFDSVFVGVKSLTEAGAGGWKQYDDSIVDVTSGQAGWNYLEGRFVPYKDPVTGNWRLKFNMQANMGSTGTATVTFTIVGVTFDADFSQHVNASVASGATGVTDELESILTAGGASTISFNMTGITAYDRIYVHGDVALASKPTWADFDGTVSLLNNSVIYSNAKFNSYGTTAAGTFLNATYKEIDNFNTADIEGGGTFDGEFYTIPADGWYEFHAQARTNDVTTSASSTIGIQLQKNSTTVLATKEKETFGVEAFPGNSVLYLGKFVAGDTVRARFRQDSGGSLGVLTNADSTFFFGKRVSDVSSESALGFGLADAGNAGLANAGINDSVTSSISTTNADCVSGSCGIDKIINGGFTTITRSATGTYTANFTASFWSTPPICTTSAFRGGDGYCQISSFATTSSVNILCKDAASNSTLDNRVIVACHGEIQ